MAGYIRTSITIILAALTYSCAAANKPMAATLDPEDEVRAIRELGVPGVLLFVRQGEKRFKASTGIADIATRRRLRGNEVWRVASVTKIVTAVIVQRLASSSMINLDDKISKHLLGVVPLADKISIRHLLNHTSGIPDYLAGRRVAINVSATRLSGSLLRYRANPTQVVIRTCQIANQKRDQRRQ